MLLARPHGTNSREGRPEITFLLVPYLSIPLGQSFLLAHWQAAGLDLRDRLICATISPLAGSSAADSRATASSGKDEGGMEEQDRAEEAVILPQLAEDTDYAS